MIDLRCDFDLAQQQKEGEVGGPRLICMWEDTVAVATRSLVLYSAPIFGPTINAFRRRPRCATFTHDIIRSIGAHLIHQARRSVFLAMRGPPSSTLASTYTIRIPLRVQFATSRAFDLLLLPKDSPNARPIHRHGTGRRTVPMPIMNPRFILSLTCTHSKFRHSPSEGDFPPLPAPLRPWSL